MRFGLPILFAALLVGRDGLAQSPSLDWSTTVSGSGYTPARLSQAPSTVRTQALAVDTAGNFVVAGMSSNGSADEALIIKYTPAGTELWRSYARSSTMNLGALRAVAIDAAGNVYVTGNEVVVVGSPRTRMVTLKLDPSGAEQWRRSLPPQFAQESSDGLALAFDQTGNLLVFGQHTGYLDRNGFLAVKYSPDGTQQWKSKVVKTTEDILLFSATVSSSGESYLAGSSGLLAKLSASGAEMWRTTLANQGGSTFVARQISTDSAGAAYVVSTFSGTNAGDVGVLKISAAGGELWRRSIGNSGIGNDSPPAIAVGADGSPVVAATLIQATSSQFVTVKLAPDGSETWRNVANAPFGGIASTVAVDSNNNVFAGGKFASRFGIEKYAPTGTLLWHAETASAGDGLDEVQALALRPDGGAVLAGTRILDPLRERDIAGLVVGPNGSGTVEWRSGIRTDLQTSILEPAADGNGNLFVTGSIALSSNGLRSAYARKLDPVGATIWSTDLEFAPYRYPLPTRPQATTDGSVVISSVASDSLLGTDTITRRLNGSGSPVWQTVLDTNFEDSAFDLLLDSSENAYVRAVPGIVKYNPAGQEIWRAAVTGKVTVNAQGESLAVGGVLDANGRSDLKVMRVSAAGQLLWQRIIDVGSTRDDHGIKGEFGPLNEVWAAGERTNVNGFYEVFLVRFALDGTESWRRFISTSIQSETFVDLQVDAAGNSYVATTSSLGAFLSKFDAGGGLQWRVTVDSANGGTTGGSKLAMDRAGNIYLSGGANKPVGTNGFWLSKITPGGLIQWRIEGAAAASEIAYASNVKVLVDGKILVAGSSQIPGGATVSKLNRYSQTLGGPQDVAAVPSDSAAYLHFSPPNSDAGFAVTGYTATCNPGAVTATGAVSPIAVTGLTNDSPYSCSVAATDARGTVASSPTVAVTPSGSAPLTVLSAYSTKLHGGAGEFHLPIRVDGVFAGPLTIEPRVEPLNHVLVLVFDRPITSFSGVTVKDSNGLSVGSGELVIDNGTLVIKLSSIPDGQKVQITLAGLNGTSTRSLTMGFHVGDVNANGRVTASDVAAIKANLGKPLTGKTFVFDTNRNGTIDSFDSSQVKLRSGSTAR